MGVVYIPTPTQRDDLAAPGVDAAVAPAAAHHAHEPAETGHESRTRDRVLSCVLEDGPLTAAELAATLGLTATGVRRHLDILVDDGLIQPCERAAKSPGSRGRGRPARAYVLSPSGHGRMNSQYDDVATAALRFLAEAAGPDAVTAFALQRAAALESRYAELVAAAGPDLPSRVGALAGALSRDGFAATTRPVSIALTSGPGDPDAGTGEPAGVQLCQGHCPMHHVAVQFPQFCEVETEVFARLLGAHVQRLSTLAGGGHVCTTYVPQMTHAPVPAGDGDTPAQLSSDERTAR